MARRKKREAHLHKVLGVPALFSTAYGNVGSSIYYALGVVALYALGLTPLVFGLTGLLFVMTAFSYAEATTIFPEAGGSSSFARHTFNEFVSFGAGWALMLDYIITIAISAFFVPNYLATFWPILKTWPYDSIGGIAVIVFLVVINIFGIKEAARLNIVLAIADLGTQVLLAVVGLFVFLSPRLLITQIHFGTAPTLHQFIYGISIGTVAYTGIETISNMAEESSNPGRDVPRAVKFVLVAVLGVYLAISMVGLSAMPVHYNELPVNPKTKVILPVAVQPAPGKEAATGPWVLKSDPSQPVYAPVVAAKLLISPASPKSDQLKATGKIYLKERAVGDQDLGHAARHRLGGRPAAGHRPEPAARSLLDAYPAGALDRPAGGHHPDHRHQRRHHRLVAAGLLDGRSQAAPADPLPRAPDALHAVCLDRLVRHHRFDPHPAGQNRPSGRPVCLRRDDLVHRRPRVRGGAALQVARHRTALEGAAERPRGQGDRAAHGGDRRHRHGHGLGRGRR